MNHYAQRVWEHSHHGSWHVYGHSHGSLPDDIKSKSIDVGVDTEWRTYIDAYDKEIPIMTTNYDICHEEDGIVKVSNCELDKIIHKRFTPYSMDEISKIMSFKTFKPVDHHNEKVD